MTLEIDTGSGLMPVHVWEPAGGSGPGLLLLQEIYGDADAYLVPEVIEQIIAAVGGPDNEIYRYAGAGHAFDNPMPAFHHAEASALAWTRTTSFLSRHLPTV